MRHNKSKQMIEFSIYVQQGEHIAHYTQFNTISISMEEVRV